MRSRLPGVVAVLALLSLGSGCGSGSAGIGGPPTAGVPGQPVAQPSATSSSPASSSGMHGVIVLYCGIGGVTITAYDPVSGQMGVSESFPTGTANIAVCPFSSTETPHFRHVRNQFSRDFRRLAATMDGPDGKHIGYLSPGGAFTDLTPAKGSNYGAVAPDQSRPLFNASTGRLWFYDANTASHLGSVDPDAGPGSQRPESAAGHRDGYFYGGFDFAADGRTLINLDGIYTPDGKSYLTPGSYLFGDQTSDWQLHQPDTDAVTATLTLAPNAPAPNCRMDGFIDTSRILCVGDGTQGSAYGLYVLIMSADRRHLSQQALLPASNNTVFTQCASPDGAKVAFISGTNLYLAGTAGQGEPRVLTALTDAVGAVAYDRVAAWEA